jgi:hypothetical protein
VTTTGDTMWKAQRRLINAANLVGETCGEALAEQAASFTCDEAEAINALLVACGNKVWSEEFRTHHAAGDTDDDDQHHGGWSR